VLIASIFKASETSVIFCQTTRRNIHRRQWSLTFLFHLPISRSPFRSIKRVSTVDYVYIREMLAIILLRIGCLPLSYLNK
jgi:hypothetical protein